MGICLAAPKRKQAREQDLQTFTSLATARVRSISKSRVSKRKVSFEQLMAEHLDAKAAFLEDLAKRGDYTLLDSPMAKLLNPFFLGGPKWPGARQAHRCLVQDDKLRVTIVSDGLADPFDAADAAESDANVDVGFGFELLAEFQLAGQSDLERFSEEDWVYQREAFIVDAVSQDLASRGREVLELLDNFGGVISAEVKTSRLRGCDPRRAPATGGGGGGAFGVLIFRSSDPRLPRKIFLPGGTAELLCMRVVPGDELAEVLGQPTPQDTLEARVALAQRFTKDGTHHVTAPW